MTGGGEKTVSTTAVGETNRGLITYTATGLDNTKVYSVALFDSANVATSSTNQVTFTSPTKLATSAGTSIEVVNGAPQTSAATGSGNTTESDGIAPVNGQITFGVDSITTGASVVPVVFFDANSSNALDFATAPTASVPQAPSEAFGVGPAASWIGPAALTGNFPSSLVSGVTANTFQAGGFTYTYNVAGSIYRYNSTAGTVPISQAQFDAYLSDGDFVSGSYNASGPSSFTIRIDVANAPTGVTAVVGSFGTVAPNRDVKVSWTAPTGSWLAS